MRRRTDRPGILEPPARLLTFDPAEWLPLVDPTGYRADDWRNVRDRVPYGPPSMTFEDWRRQEAHTLWMQARVDWCKQHGWPDGSDVIAVIVASNEASLDGGTPGLRWRHPRGILSPDRTPRRAGPRRPVT